MIKKVRKLFVLFLLTLVFTTIRAQVIENSPPVRQVLGTTGGTYNFPWGSLDYTVGEVMVTTDSATSSPFSLKWLTQGFQQPDKSGLSLDAISVNSTCKGASNGSASLSVIYHTGTVKYSWNGSPYSSTYLFTNLGPGDYHYVVKDTDFSISGVITITEAQVDCLDQLTVYHGLTPNGDGHNDKWEIDGITNFHSNIVSIYNRWGELIWTAKNYDNDTVIWDGKSKSGESLPDGTYFYVIEAGGKVQKGWVELTQTH